MSTVHELADNLARDTLASQEILGDDLFYEKVSKVLGAGSPTFQEAFLTAIRVRLTEIRGRAFLNEALTAIGAPLPAAAAAPVQFAAPAAEAPVPAEEAEQQEEKKKKPKLADLKAANWPEDWAPSSTS